MGEGPERGAGGGQPKAQSCADRHARGAPLGLGPKNDPGCFLELRKSALPPRAQEDSAEAMDTRETGARKSRVGLRTPDTWGQALNQHQTVCLGATKNQTSVTLRLQPTVDSVWPRSWTRRRRGSLGATAHIQQGILGSVPGSYASASAEFQLAPERPSGGVHLQEGKDLPTIRANKQRRFHAPIYPKKRQAHHGQGPRSVLPRKSLSSLLGQDPPGPFERTERNRLLPNYIRIVSDRGDRCLKNRIKPGISLRGEVDRERAPPTLRPHQRPRSRPKFPEFGVGRARDCRAMVSAREEPAAPQTRDTVPNGSLEHAGLAEPSL